MKTRALLFSLAFGLSATVCLAQNDSSRTTQAPTVQQVPIQGVDTPLSGPGTLLQSSPNPNAAPLPETKRKKGRVMTRPTDPRAFGVAVPLGTAKKDSIRN